MSTVALAPSPAGLGHRRLLMTVHLPMVGQEFSVGAVRCVGRRLCEPCSHLQRLTRRALLRPMVHRGGLRADSLTHGLVRTGDPVTT